MAINKTITTEDTWTIYAVKTLKAAGSHTEAVTFDVGYCVCDADDATYKVSRQIQYTVADPTALTLAQVLDAIRDAIKTAEGI